MTKKLLNISIFLFSFLISGFVNFETGWEYEQSTFQAFYIFENLNVDGSTSEGDGCVPNDDCDQSSCYCCSNPNSCDVVGAFYNGVCVGWVYSDSEGYTTVPAMGNDGNYSDYPSTGDIVNFKLYDSNYNTIIDIVPGSNIPGWENFAIEVIYGDSYANNVFQSGCTDELACNYDASAVVDDGGCIYQSNELALDFEVVGNSVVLTWDDPLGFPPFTYFLDNDEVESPHLIDDLEWGAEYSFILTTVDFNASSGECEPVESEQIVQIGDEPLPGQVSGLIASSSDGRVVLDWDEIDSNLEYYNVYVFDEQDILLESQVVYDSYLIHDNLLPDFTYKYNVEAVNSQGYSGEPSQSIYATTSSLLTVDIEEITVGQGYIRLDWTIGESDYNGDSYLFDIYQNEELIYTSYFNTYLANDLIPGQSYCFVVVPKIYTDYLDTPSVAYADSSAEVCGTPSDITSWSVLVSLNIQGWGDEVVSDLSSEFGMHSDATDTYDPVFDIFEPIEPPSDWASFYFPHSDWYIELGDNFTSDFRQLRDLSSGLEIWDAEFISDVPGPAQLNFDFINLSNAGDWPVYLKLQTTADDSLFDYYKLSDNSEVDFFYLPENNIRFAQLIVGNSNPGAPVGFEAVGGPRRMDLSWDERQLCSFDEAACSDLDNRYAATGYKIFRNSELHHLITLSNNKISFHLDQIYVNDNEQEIVVTQNADHGQILIDCYESYIDENFNGQYDLGEPFVDCGLDGLCLDDDGFEGADEGESDNICNRFIQYTPENNFVGNDHVIISDSLNGDKVVTFSIVNDMIYSYTDESLLGSNIYNYYMIAYNHAGDSATSLLSSDVTDPNILPVADGGDDQVYYLYEEGVESVEVSLPRNDDGTSNNYSYDPDAFENEYLVYSWELLEGEDWLVVSDEPSFEYVLDISEHYFRHRVMDVTNMWSAYDSVTVEVKGLPEPAQIESITIESSLYYLKLDWDRSFYDQDDMPEGYDGTGYLATHYEIYYDGENEILTIIEDDPASPTMTYVDNGLSPSINNQVSEYCYTIYAVNVQGLRSQPITECASLGVQPSVRILSPNGAEIVQSGFEDYLVSWEFENSQYVDNIEILYNSNYSSGNNIWETVYFSNELSSGCLIIVPDTDGITNDNKFKIIINDIGDYNGDNSNSYQDESDNTFIVSNNNLEYQLSSGVNLIGAPLSLDSSINLVDHLGSDDDDLGDFWLAFNGLGESSLFNDFSLTAGDGYYLLNIDDGYFTISGDLLLGPVELELQQGWNLIANPLVANIQIDNLIVKNNEELFSWQDATGDNPILSPALIGYDNLETSHYISHEILPFHGYWVHSLKDDTSILFESLPYDESLGQNNPIDMIESKITLTASESYPSNPSFSVGDFIVIGMGESYDDQFLYGEDLYDFPSVVASKFTNIYINHSQDWFASNQIDLHGNLIESPRFMTDIRSFSDAAQWHISGELLGTIGSVADIRLDWAVEGFMGEDLMLLINGREPIDMLLQNFVDDLNSDEFQNFTIQLGNVLSNDSFSANEFRIENPYPNPFNPQTSLSFNIPISGYTNVSVYNVSGALIDVLEDSYLESGYHTINWNAKSQSSGVYFFRITYADQSIVKKAILLK